MDIKIKSASNQPSSFRAYDSHLAVVGTLSHGVKIQPESIEDADKMIQWLEDWKTKKGGE